MLKGFFYFAIHNYYFEGPVTRYMADQPANEPVADRKHHRCRFAKNTKLPGRPDDFRAMDTYKSGSDAMVGNLRKGYFSQLQKAWRFYAGGQERPGSRAHRIS